MNAKSRELEATHAQIKELQGERTEAEKELGRLRSDLKGKCEELHERNFENQMVKDRDTKRRKRVKTTFDRVEAGEEQPVTG